MLKRLFERATEKKMTAIAAAFAVAAFMGAGIASTEEAHKSPTQKSPQCPDPALMDCPPGTILRESLPFVGRCLIYTCEPSHIPAEPSRIPVSNVRDRTIPN